MNVTADILRANSRKYQDLIKNFEKSVGKDASLSPDGIERSGRLPQTKTRPRPPMSKSRVSLAPSTLQKDVSSRKPRMSLNAREKNVLDVLDEPPLMFADHSDDESIDHRLDQSLYQYSKEYDHDISQDVGEKDGVFFDEEDESEVTINEHLYVSMTSTSNSALPIPTRILTSRPSLAHSSVSNLPVGFATATPAVRRKLSGRPSIAFGGQNHNKTFSNIGSVMSSSGDIDELGRHINHKHKLDDFQEDLKSHILSPRKTTTHITRPRQSGIFPPPNFPSTRKTAPRPSLPRGNISFSRRISNFASNIPQFPSSPKKSKMNTPPGRNINLARSPLIEVEYEHHSPGQDTSFNSDIVLQSPISDEWSDEKALDETQELVLESIETPPRGELIDSYCNTHLPNLDTIVCLRTRPLLEREIAAGWYSAITNTHNTFYVHQPSMHWKGPKLETAEFKVDLAFGQDDSNEIVYERAIKHSKMLEMVIGGGVGTIFAYGQTGSGKTYTMTSLQRWIAKDIFHQAEKQSIEDGEKERFFKIHVSFFELLGKDAFDLLNDRAPVRILEDVHGSIQIPGLSEFEINSSNEFESLIEAASLFRKTSATLKNDASSRSHAVCHVRIENGKYRSAEDGKLLIVDLAGSERAADSIAHDKARMDETKEINKSLMTLKDCIRGRALAAMNLSKHVHVPYRTSRLTILLKDSFELSTARVCKTIVIAHCSPSIHDAAHSLNTLRYAQPFKVAIPKDRSPPDPNNPANWTHEQMQNWIKKNSKWVDPDVLCPYESGLQLTRLPEAEWIRRCCLCPHVSEKGAKQFYVKLWGLVVEARIKTREEKLKKISSPMEKTEKKKVGIGSVNSVSTKSSPILNKRTGLTTSKSRTVLKTKSQSKSETKAMTITTLSTPPLDLEEAKEKEKDLWRRKLKEMRENKGVKVSIKDAGVTSTSGMHSKTMMRVALSPRGSN